MGIMLVVNSHAYKSAGPSKETDLMSRAVQREQNG